MTSHFDVLGRETRRLRLLLRLSDAFSALAFVEAVIHKCSRNEYSDFAVTGRKIFCANVKLYESS